MRHVAGAVIAAFVVLGTASVGKSENIERVALARAEAALAAAAVEETRCPSDRDSTSDAGCAAEDASGDGATEQPAQQSTPAQKPSTGVCARNPDTGRRKCSVRYLA
ncbi:MAG TPA: hypothetical protein VFL14_05355 [Xanthomonadales bacterium]|nr:hypothetical protein [Xanthomonadales bacterium]